MVRKISLLMILLAFLWSPSPLAARGRSENSNLPAGPSWPRWRGANGDGVSAEASWDPIALKGTPKILWRRDVGTGYSSAAIQGRRLYTMGMRDDQWSVFCIDAGSGRAIWKKSTPNVLSPHSTPTVDGDRLYCLNQDGSLLCLRTSNGATLWKADLAHGFNAIRPNYGWAASPVVEGSLLLVNANSMQMALNKMTGELVWKFDDPMPRGTFGSYATPVVLVTGGIRCALFLGPGALISVDVATGKKLWSFPHEDPVHPTADPVVTGDSVFIALDTRSVLLRAAPGAPLLVWESSVFSTWLSPPVLVNGFLYGSIIPAGTGAALGSWDTIRAYGLPFRCVELKSGRLMWEKDMNYVSLMAADGKLIMIELDGTLHVAEATPAAHKEIAVSRVLSGGKGPRVFGAPPVLCNGRLYCRNMFGDLVCIDMRPAGSS